MAAAGAGDVPYGSHKPSKLEDADLVAYLRSLDVPLEAAAAATTDDAPAAETAALLRGLFRETHKREAAVATHKATAHIIERALRISPLRALTRFLCRLAPYIVFVATNRFGSHVLETALSRAHALLLAGDAAADGEASDGGGEGDDDDDAGGAADAEWRAAAETVALPPSLIAAATAPPATARAARLALVAAVCGLAATAVSAVSDLIFDVSGTHVLRAVTAVLGGRAPPSYRHALDTYAPKTAADDRKSRGPAGAAFKAQTALTASAAATITASTPALVLRQWHRALASTDASQALTACLVRLVHALGEADHEATAAAAAASPAAVAASASAATFRPAVARLPEASPEASAAATVDSNMVALATDTNAAPTLQLMLDVVCVAAPATGRYLTRRLVNWGLQALTADARSGAADVMAAGRREAADHAGTSAPPPPSETGDGSRHRVAALRQHAIGSHTLECVLLHADAGLTLALWQRCFAGTLSSLALHGAGNFVVQRLLVSLPAADAVAAALRELVPHAAALFAAHRDGVLWHMVAACVGGATLARVAAASAASAATGIARVPGAEATASAGGPPRAGSSLPVVPAFAAHLPRLDAVLQREVVEAIVGAAAAGARDAGITAAGALASRGKHGGSSADGAGAGAGLLSAASALRSDGAGIIAWLLDVNGCRSRRGAEAAAALPEYAPVAGVHAIPQVAVSAAGARILATALHLDVARVPVVQALWEAFAALPPSLLVPLAAEPFTARHVLEAIWDPAVTGDGLAWLRTKVFSGLRGSFASLAASRFGCWSVTKAFHVLDDRRRTVIAAELVAGEHALSGSGGGRQVVRLLRLEHYKRNVDSWLASWSRATEKAASFADLLNLAPKVRGAGSKAAAAASADGGDGAGADAEGATSADIDAAGEATADAGNSAATAAAPAAATLPAAKSSGRGSSAGAAAAAAAALLSALPSRPTATSSAAAPAPAPAPVPPSKPAGAAKMGAAAPHASRSDGSDEEDAMEGRSAAATAAPSRARLAPAAPTVGARAKVAPALPAAADTKNGDDDEEEEAEGGADAGGGGAAPSVPSQPIAGKKRKRRPRAERRDAAAAASGGTAGDSAAAPSAKRARGDGAAGAKPAGRAPSSDDDSDGEGGGGVSLFAAPSRRGARV